MSHKANISIEQVVSSGPGLAFIVYPKAISLMPLPHFWAIIFFFMIFLLGIDSQFVTCESGMIRDFKLIYLFLFQIYFIFI
jgi:SNF family Na+-dependent transporter